jgi:signal transduction histidine kinase
MSDVHVRCLQDNKERILSLWEDRCLKEVVSAASAGTLALRNSLPLFLDHLCEALATNRKMDVAAVTAHVLESLRIGKLHGADRASNRSYQLREVILEYHILREVLFDALETQSLLPKPARDIVLDSIEQAVNDAVVEFTEVQADLQQKFFDTLTHDLRTPVSVARMNAKVTLRRGDLAGPVIAAQNNILISLNRLDAMIENLLDGSRIRAGERLCLQFTNCDLAVVIRDVVEEMRMVYGPRIVAVSEGELHGNWGAEGVRRAVENLITNAVKFGAAETPITISWDSGIAAIEVTVQNEGPVIPEQEIPRLFQKFRRATSKDISTPPGWGLGLTVVKGVVDAHKGKIHVASAEGTGTRFTLEIPCAPPPGLTHA